MKDKRRRILEFAGAALVVIAALVVRTCHNAMADATSPLPSPKPEAVSVAVTDSLDSIVARTVQPKKRGKKGAKTDAKKRTVAPDRDRLGESVPTDTTGF